MNFFAHVVPRGHAEIMPLIYYSLESDNPVVLEKALRVVPKLCETLDYTTVKQTLFPKITTVFSKTTLLSVKVNTLICFHAMISVLDKFTLTEKLVPLLARIKTKEPSVMIATLAVHEEMGKKCEVEAGESVRRLQDGWPLLTPSPLCRCSRDADTPATVGHVDRSAAQRRSGAFSSSFQFHVPTAKPQ